MALLLQIGPLAATGVLSPGAGSRTIRGSEISGSTMVGLMLSGLAGVVTTSLAGIVLSGLLTVVVGRAVFGARSASAKHGNGFGDASLPLLGITALEAIGAAVLIAVIVGLVVAVAQIAGGAAAFIVGALFGAALVALLVYLYTMLSFAPTLIVLERIGVMPAITRSFALVKNDFWRVFGIRLLAVVVAGVVAGAVTAPFSFVGQIMLMLGGSTGHDGRGRRTHQRRWRHRADHHGAVQCRRRRAPLRRPPDPGRSIRSSAADRCDGRSQLHRRPLADPSPLTCPPSTSTATLRTTLPSTS